jgi:hypothetical protein
MGNTGTRYGETAGNIFMDKGNAAGAARMNQYNQQRGAVEGIIKAGIDVGAMSMGAPPPSVLGKVGAGSLPKGSFQATDRMSMG